MNAEIWEQGCTVSFLGIFVSSFWCCAWAHHLGELCDPLNHSLHCKEKMPKIWNKYSQKRSIGASVPISPFMCLWANFIFPRWVCLFCWRKYVDRFWDYINRSQTHECGNWGWGRAILRKGIYKWRCSVRGTRLTSRQKETRQSLIKVIL